MSTGAYYRLSRAALRSVQLSTDESSDGEKVKALIEVTEVSLLVFSRQWEAGFCAERG